MTIAIILTIKEKFTNLTGNIYIRAFIYSLVGFLVLRLFSSSVMLLDIFFPSPDAVDSEITRRIINGLKEQNNFFRFFLAPWYRWDTARYLEISNFGYDFNLVNVVWPPLYPFLVKIFSFIFKPSIFASIIVSNLFLVFSLFLFYLLTNDYFDEEIAKKSLFFLLLFPSSFYFIAGYSESLFLFLSISVFLLLRKKRWLWAGFIAALATLTRVQGLLLVIPILVELVKEHKEEKILKQLFTHSIACVYAPISYGLYSMYVHYGLHTDYPWVMLNKYWNQRFGLPWEGIIGTTRFLINNIGKYYDPSQFMNFLNLSLVLVTAILLVTMRKKIPLSLSIYSWFMLFVIIGKIDHNDVFVGSIRYIMVIFPIYWEMVFLVNNKVKKIFFFSISIILQIIQIVFFYWWVWVS